MATPLDRLRARGEVRIDADAFGYHVSWWPKGQKGNPFCGRGLSGTVLEPLIEELVEATRPTTRDFYEAKYAREWQAEHDQAWNQRCALAACDRDDRRREKRSWERERYRQERARSAEFLAAQRRHRANGRSGPGVDG